MSVRRTYNSLDSWIGGAFGAAPFRGTYRPGLMEFEITDDVVAGRGTALANPRYGPGGLEQFYIPDWEHVESPVVTRLMRNTVAH